MSDVLLVYIAGGLTAMLMDKIYARRKRVRTNPLLAFILSWALVLLAILFSSLTFIMYIVDKYEMKWRDL